jgi:hypothetical protein
MKLHTVELCKNLVVPFSCVDLLNLSGECPARRLDFARVQSSQ